MIEIRESARARNARIEIHPDGRVVATKPKRMPGIVFRVWLKTKESWIRDSVEKFERLAARRVKSGQEHLSLPRPRKGSKAYKEAREAARASVKARLAHYAALYGFSYGTISIRDQKTRWGSCSVSNNLSFNYRLVFLPPELADYVIVHELCHTKEHNHSKAFWALVGQAFPNHTALRKQLHRYAS